MKNLRNKSISLSTFIAGVLGHHYISKLLEYQNDIQSIKDQEFRDNNISQIQNSLADLNKSVERANTMLDNITSKNIPDNAINSLQEKFDKSELFCKEVVDLLDKQKGSVNEDLYLNAFRLSQKCLKSVEETNRELIEFFDKYGSKNNFTFNLHEYTDYLNSLSLFEISVLFHISILVLILILLSNLFSVFFSNEIIKYFQLEEKYPK